MNRILKTSLIMIIAGAALALPGAASRTEAQAAQKGVPVNMAQTTHAQPVPAADRNDALIVTIVRNGAIYVGTTEVKSADLAEKLKATPLNRENPVVYIKADANGRYSDVIAVMDAAYSVGLNHIQLLTRQDVSHAAGANVPPAALEAHLGSLTRTAK